MVWRRSGAIFILFLFFLKTAISQWIDDAEYDKLVKRGVEEVYNLRFSEAEKTLREVIGRWPDHPSGYFFAAMIDWWKIMDDPENTSYDEEFIRKLDSVIEMCDRILQKSPDDVTALFFKAGSIGFRGRLRAYRESWLLAANDGRLAVPVLLRLYKVDPHSYDVLLGIGIYNYYAEVIPQEYPFVKPFMVLFPRGDRKKGIEQLTIASQRARYAWAEATYFLLQIYYVYEKDYWKSLSLAEKLLRAFPQNALFHRFVGRCNVALSRWEEAYRVWTEILARCDRGEVGYNLSAKREAFYYLGLYHFSANHLEEALRYLYACDELSRTVDRQGPSPFMIMTNLKIGMIYDLQKKRDLAIMQYKKVAGWKDFSGSRRDAEKYLRQPYGS